MCNTDIRRFHGTCNFYRRFIKDFSKITVLLNELLKEDEFIWNTEAQLAFEELKKALMTKPVIQPFDLLKPKRLEYNISDYTIGAILH